MSDAGAGRNLIRALHWRRLDTPGSEYFTLSQAADGWKLDGTVAVTIDGRPLLVRYTVRCDPEWKTEDADVVVDSGGIMQRLRLGAAGGRWRSNEGSVTTLDGAVDVDLGVTPSTNTLPIRRLELDIGEHADLVVAWIRFPDLSVLRSDQRYTRLAENTYRYESGSFSRDIEVDELGLVTKYPGLFVNESLVSA
ncbi:MAG TPA: putative glycolipid-binding domain-containing protein [Actinomycetota bacterium]|nr:putative glycolipid-binding domain-containing protein [Actinomycetota bacterium]